MKDELLLPTKEQWLEVAEKVQYNNSWRFGICNYLVGMGFGSTRNYPRFMKPFAPHGKKSSYKYWWPTDDAGDRERAFFCCMMAAITKAGDMESLIQETN